MLGVSPSTLRSWERRFGFPAPRRSTGGHRQYELAESPGEAHRQILDLLDARARHAPVRAHDEPSLLPRRRSANA